MNYKCLVSGIRLDAYLADYLNISRNKVQKMIRNDLILVNNKKVNASYIVKVNDDVYVKEILEENKDVNPVNIPLDIIYEDDDLLVINKKSGMVVEPAPGHYDDTLANAILAYLGDSSALRSIRYGIVHRLDKDTSGVMLVAKNDFTYRALVDMLANRKVEKHYLALVDGVLEHDIGTIDAPIGRDINNRKKMAVTDCNSKEAVTHFKVLKRFKKATYVECILETGRTHQIRVHMAYIGHKILNDPVYGKGKTSEFGQMLHSKSIKFIHPRTLKELYFEVDVPKEFKEKLEELEKYE